MGGTSSNFEDGGLTASLSLPARLRAQLVEGVLAPGCYDALSAALVRQAGFDAAYLSGGSLAYTRLGRPDVGLVSLTEVADTIGLIADRIDIPLIVDADTGFGNALNVQRTVRMFERMGAAAIQLEDQEAPKRCGHLAGKTLISTQEMVGKIGAALDARNEALIIARTDAIAVEGIAAAFDRAAAYAEAGADLLFIEAPPRIAEMQEICTRFAPDALLVANMVEGGKTPVLPFGQLRGMGYRLVIFPGAFARALVFMGRELLGVLKSHGTTQPYWDRMVDLAGINDAVETSALLATGRRYAGSASKSGVTDPTGAA